MINSKGIECIFYCDNGYYFADGIIIREATRTDLILFGVRLQQAW